MGAIYGNLRRHPSDIGNEGAIREEKRNHRKTLWKCKGESWFSIYADVRKNPDGNEGRVYICVYEFEKVSKDKVKTGIAGSEKTTQNFYFERNSFDKRKMALGYKSQSHFVYSLRGLLALFFIYNSSTFFISTSLSPGRILSSFNSLIALILSTVE